MHDYFIEKSLLRGKIKASKEVRKMDNFKLTFGVEPTDNYAKAKQDVLQAMLSVRSLTPLEQQKLATEVFGATQVAIAMEAFRQLLGGQSK